MEKQGRRQLVLVVGLALLVGGGAGCVKREVVQAPQPEAFPRIGGPTLEEVKAPEWVTKKGKAFSGDRRAYYGVGNVAGIVNPGLLRKAAEASARQDLLTTLKVYQAGLFRMYQESTTAGQGDKQAEGQDVRNMIKQLTDNTLVASEVVEYWEHPKRNEAYALVRWDVERFEDMAKTFQGALGTSRELEAQVRDFVRRNADRAYDELNQELSKRGQETGVVPPPAPRERISLASGDFLPVVNGELRVHEPVPSDVPIGDDDVVVVPYGALVAVTGGRDLMQWAGQPVTIGAEDLVEMPFGDFVVLALGHKLTPGSIVVVEMRQGRPVTTRNAGDYKPTGPVQRFYWAPRGSQKNEAALQTKVRQMQGGGYQLIDCWYCPPPPPPAVVAGVRG